ncbi:MAG: hypothetical protein FD167_5545, partial [bacterium]
MVFSDFRIPKKEVVEKAKRVKLRKTERKLEKEEARELWYKSLS